MDVLNLVIGAIWKLYNVKYTFDGYSFSMFDLNVTVIIIIILWNMLFQKGDKK